MTPDPSSSSEGCGPPDYFDPCFIWKVIDTFIQAMDQDALLAQLLGMGFGIEEIERCQVAMATSSRPYSLQEATEWYLY